MVVNLKYTKDPNNAELQFNLGVIAAGILVNLLNSNQPDLIIGIIIFVLVIQGAIRILKLGK